MIENREEKSNLISGILERLHFETERELDDFLRGLEHIYRPDNFEAFLIAFLLYYRPYNNLLFEDCFCHIILSNKENNEEELTKAFRILWQRFQSENLVINKIDTK